MVRKDWIDSPPEQSVQELYFMDPSLPSFCICGMGVVRASSKRNATKMDRQNVILYGLTPRTNRLVKALPFLFDSKLIGVYNGGSNINVVNGSWRVFEKTGGVYGQVGRTNKI